MKNILDGHGQHLKLLTLRRFTQFQGSTIKTTYVMPFRPISGLNDKKLLTLYRFTQFQGSTIKNYLPYAVSPNFRAQR